MFWSLSRGAGAIKQEYLFHPLSFSLMQKILVTLTVVFSLGAAAVGFLNHGNLATAREENIASQKKAKESADRADKAAAEAKSANEKLAATSADAEKYRTENDDLKKEKESYQTNLSGFQTKISDLENSNTQLKAQISEKDSKISELESKSSQTSQAGNGAADELKKTLEEKEILISSLQNKLKDQDSQLASLKEREAQRRTKIMKRGLEGRILAVNSSWNFVVLSLGDRNGVVNGSEMLIKRGAQLLGKARITSVEPSTSIADIVANSVRQGTSVMPGDTVIYAGPSDDNEAAPVQ
jgi:predicted RNase H-like nuclease (RuvC/YqgF family)